LIFPAKFLIFEINAGRWEWLRSEPVDAAQDVGKQVTGDGDPGIREIA